MPMFGHSLSSVRFFPEARVDAAADLLRWRGGHQEVAGQRQHLRLQGPGGQVEQAAIFQVGQEYSISTVL